MGIFKDLFRDISESKMTMCELEIKWAQEKEAERDGSGAGYHYEQAKERERAGDAYLQGWKKKEGGCEFYGPKNASKCYYKAKNYDKMREAYQECLWTNVWDPEFTNECVRRLTAAHQMDTFVKHIIRTFTDYDRDSFQWEKHPRLNGLLEGLIAGELTSEAAELVRYFPRALRYEKRDAIEGLVRTGKNGEALEIYRFLTNKKVLDKHDQKRCQEPFRP